MVVETDLPLTQSFIAAQDLASSSCDWLAYLLRPARSACLNLVTACIPTAQDYTLVSIAVISCFNSYCLAR